MKRGKGTSKENGKKRSRVIQLSILVMVFMLALFTGCSSDEEAKDKADTKVSDENTAEALEEGKEQTDKTEDKDFGTASDAAAESSSVPESTLEPVVYEGIDMESDLPGAEWIQTFKGVVDEPVATIYNDNTGRKEIIQEGSTVTVNPDEDKFAVFLPEGGMDSRLKLHGGGVKDFVFYEILSVNPEGARTAPEWENSITVTGGTEDWLVNFTMVVE